MTFDQFLNLFLNIQIWMVAKLMICFALFLYIFFALIVMRQVNLMTQAIKFPLEGLLKMVATSHLLGTILILLLALIIL